MGQTVAGLELPHELVDLLRDGHWQAPEPAVLERVFGDRPSAPRFYDLRGMEGETSSWVEETDPLYLGTPPEDLDPGNSVIIGDLGPDQPLALDYRSDPPCVRYLGIDGGWRIVAPTIGRLAAELGLRPGDP